MSANHPTCPCGRRDYENCCGQYHHGASAPDAESLMRSRYSAYTLKLEAYLLATWHASTRPKTLELATDNAKWLGLAVKSCTSDSADCASVEFVARYKIAGRAHRLHEISHFVRENGQWFYVAGEFPRSE